MSVIQEAIVNSGHGSLSAQYFAVHSTANPGATAANHRDLWSRGYDYAVHLVSDWNTAYHCVPYDRLCWQVGNGNYTCEGLEICEATNQADFDKGIQIAAQVVRERLAAHGWGVDRMHPHAWFSQTYGGSDHTDALPYFARFGYSWEQFVALVANTNTDSNNYQGDDMPAKTDQINLLGQTVTVEYALQAIVNNQNAIVTMLRSITPAEITKYVWFGQGDKVEDTPLYSLRDIQNKLKDGVTENTGDIRTAVAQGVKDGIESISVTVK